MIPLGQVADVVTGGTPPTQEAGVFGGPYPFVTPADIGAGTRLTRANRSLSPKGLRYLRPLLPGTVLVTCIGALIGKVGIADVPLATNQQINALVPRARCTCGEFLMQAMIFARPKLERLAGTQAIPIVNKTTLEGLEIPIPPLPEQRRIAAILGTWDAAIEKLESLRAVSEKRYKALAHQFFDPCHPTFSGRPNTWREFELGNVFRERSQPGKEGDRLLSITMNGGVIDRDDVGRKDTSTEDKSNYKLILPGDLGYNTMRMWQGVSGLSALRGIISPAYTVITPIATGSVGSYAAHLFKSPRMVFDFKRYSQGLTSDTWNLKYPAFSKIRVFLPPVEDQQKQADLLDALTAERSALDRQIHAVALQKRGLMQKLLTGKIRVPEAIADLSPAAD